MEFKQFVFPFRFCFWISTVFSSFLLFFFSSFLFFFSSFLSFSSFSSSSSSSANYQLEEKSLRKISSESPLLVSSRIIVPQNNSSRMDTVPLQKRKHSENWDRPSPPTSSLLFSYSCQGIALLNKGSRESSP